MKVHELIALLGMFDPDLTVTVWADDGSGTMPVDKVEVYDGGVLIA